MEIKVSAEVGASRAELDAVEEAFRRAGLGAVAADDSVLRSGAGPLPWVLYIMLGAPIATFFTTLAAEAAKDAYQPIKRWAKDVLAARVGDGSVRLSDDEGTALVLHSGLPDKALEALSDIDWNTFNRGGDIHWSESRGEWLDVFEMPEAF
jgi:hypothetical protein